MTEINLLPWREQTRKFKKIKFGMMLGASVVAAIVLVIFGHIYFNGSLSTQQARNDFLQQQMTEVQTNVTALKAQKKVQDQVSVDLNFLTQLREHSYQAVQILQELARLVPNAVSFTKIARLDNVVTVTGEATSNLEITAFMRNLSHSPLFKQPELTQITARENMSGEERFFQIKAQMQG